MCIGVVIKVCIKWHKPTQDLANHHIPSGHFVNEEKNSSNSGLQLLQPQGSLKNKTKQHQRTLHMKGTNQHTAK